MICLLLLTKQFKSLLETRFCKCSVEFNLNSMKCSKTEVGCLHTQKNLYIENIGISFSWCILRTYNTENWECPLAQVSDYLS